MGIKIPDILIEQAQYSDVEEIQSYALEYVDSLRKIGLIRGKDGNKFDPKADATRAEVATIIMRMLTR